jgi:hypothetical protein
MKKHKTLKPHKVATFKLWALPASAMPVLVSFAYMVWKEFISVVYIPTLSHDTTFFCGWRIFCITISSELCGNMLCHNHSYNTFV